MKPIWILLGIFVFIYIVGTPKNFIKDIFSNPKKQVSQRVIPKEALKVAEESRARRRSEESRSKRIEQTKRDEYNKLSWHEKAKVHGIAIEEINQLVRDLKSNNQLKTKCRLAKAYIDPAIWYSIDVFVKENVAKALAMYCAQINEWDPKKKVWVDIYDLNTGKKIAKYDVWGFKIY